jgi:mRNA interferase MazF
MVKPSKKLQNLTRGEVIRVSFDPIIGHERAGYRPALVISDAVFHRATGFALCLPITSKKKGLLFEIEIHGKHITGVALPHGARMLDLEHRNFICIEKMPNDVIVKAQIVLSKIITG